MTDTLDAIATDHRTNSVATRDAIRTAVAQVAAEHDGLVHVSWVRPLLPAYREPAQVGAGICALVRARVLVATGAYLPSGNSAQRNATRPAAVYRLASPL